MVESLAIRPRVAPRLMTTVIGAEPIGRSGVTRSLPENRADLRKQITSRRPLDREASHAHRSDGRTFNSNFVNKLQTSKGSEPRYTDRRLPPINAASPR